MKTFLFDSIIFGPIQSRRLGISLGVNLLPVERKFCNFDCIYCECGFNEDGKGVVAKLPTRQDVFKLLNEKLMEMVHNKSLLDVITFAGNGEPTIHPEFCGIIEDTLALRNQYFPDANVSVLSNATMLHRSEVVEALKKVNQNILKLDAGILKTIIQIDRPTATFDIGKLIEQLKSFHGQFIMQTMFVRGMVDEIWIDNTTPEEVAALKCIIANVLPEKVMIYSLDRNTPVDGLEKVSVLELQQIATEIELLGIEVQVAG